MFGGRGARQLCSGSAHKFIIAEIAMMRMRTHLQSAGFLTSIVRSNIIGGIIYTPKSFDFCPFKIS